jgi:membrane associated rhomboid family serine protease
MFGPLPPAVRVLLISNVVIFLLQWYVLPQLALFALYPLQSPAFRPWQIVTYAFLHGNGLHIFFNMFALYMFGGPLEEFLGTRRFVIFYFASVIAAACTQLVVMYGTGLSVPVVGASGGVFGLLLAFAFYFPRQKVFLLLLPIPMPAWLFVTLYGVLELWLGITGTQSGVAHFAHLGGMLGGAATLIYWNARRGIRRRY